MAQKLEKKMVTNEITQLLNVIIEVEALIDDDIDNDEHDDDLIDFADALFMHCEILFRKLTELTVFVDIPMPILPQRNLTLESLRNGTWFARAAPSA